VVMAVRCWANVRRLGPSGETAMKEFAIDRRQRTMKRLLMDRY
jgi:hypothetical protein